MLLRRRQSGFIYALICFLVIKLLTISLTKYHPAKIERHQYREAIVTLLTDDSYLCGALVLAYTLKKYGATKERNIFVLIPHGTLNNTHHISMLKQVGWTIINVKRMPFPFRVDRRLEDGLVKLYAWNMTQYTTIATLDADTMVIGSIEEPFHMIRMNLNIQMLAVNNLFMAGFKLYKKWKYKYFNAGVLFFRPKTKHFENLVHHALNKTYYDFRTPQQNLLNTYYLDQWYELSMIYNLLDYLPHKHSLFKHHWNNNTRIVHFAGTAKPWHPNIKNGNHSTVISDTKNIWRRSFSEMVKEYSWAEEDFLRQDALKSSVLQFDFKAVVNRTA